VVIEKELIKYFLGQK